MLPFRNVLCPTDFSEPSELGVAAAAELARHFRASLRLVHVVATLPAPTPDVEYHFRVPEYSAALHADADRKLAQYAERYRGDGVSVECSVVHGDAGRQIAALAKEHAADVIVVATHGETGWRHAVFGSVAERVVHLAPCPVLVVRPPAD